MALKAGVVPNRRLNEIVDERSKFVIFQKKRELRVSEQAEHVASLVRSLSDDYVNLSVDHFLESAREFSTANILQLRYLHLDMDAFFASVECLEQPFYNDVPMAVGGTSMLATANYAARQYGISSAMPGYIAKRLCPDLVILKPNYQKYERISHDIKAILQDYDDGCMMFSLDEASMRLDPQILADTIESIRQRIWESTGLTCSMGVSYSRKLAKLCSNMKKPNGVSFSPFDLDSVQTWLSDIPISKLRGVGKVTAQFLDEAYGIKTCRDAYNKRYILSKFYSDWQGLLCSALGLEVSHEKIELHHRQSISVDRTVAISSLDESISVLHSVVLGLITDAIKNDCMYARTLTLRLKKDSFEVLTRSKTYPTFSCIDFEDLLSKFTGLLLDNYPGPLRLLGVKFSNFETHLSNTLESYVGVVNPDLPVGECGRCGLEDVRFSIDSLFVKHHSKECRPEEAPKGIKGVIPLEFYCVSGSAEMSASLEAQFGDRLRKSFFTKPRNL